MTFHAACLYLETGSGLNTQTCLCSSATETDNLAALLGGLECTARTELEADRSLWRMQAW